MNILKCAVSKISKYITSCLVLYVCNVIPHIRCEILGQYIFFITLFLNTPNSMSFSERWQSSLHDWLVQIPDETPDIVIWAFRGSSQSLPSKWKSGNSNKLYSLSSKYFPVYKSPYIRTAIYFETRNNFFLYILRNNTNPTVNFFLNRNQYRQFSFNFVPWKLLSI